MIPSRKEGGLKHMTHRTKCSSSQELPTERGDTTFWEKENLAMPLQGAPAHARCQQHEHSQISASVLRERGQIISLEV